MLRRYIVLCLGWLLCVGIVKAQFDPQIGQYMFMQATYNPAAVGDGELMRVYGSHRMDFTGIDGAPMTTYFSFSSPFTIGKTMHGAGVRFVNDQFGLFSNQSLYLSIGAELGFMNLSFAVDSVDLGDGNDDYHVGSDEAVPNTSGSSEKGASGMGFDLGVGVYYSAASWWAGVSYGHVTNPTLQWSDKSSIRVRGTLYAAGGYNWRLKNKDWVLMPSAMLQTDFRAWDVNLTMLAQLRERFRFGLGYRIAGSVNVILGVDIINGLQLGYTYEMPANSLLKESYGSHELYLAYGFNVLKPKRTNKYKSIRYL